MPTDPDFSPEAIAEALRLATSGEWAVYHHEDDFADVTVNGRVWCRGLDRHDAHLIANAPTWLAQLLAALEAEREAHARRVGELDRCNERVLEVLAVLEYERNEFDKALATAEAALEASERERERLREALAQATLVVEAAQRWSKQPGTMAVVVLESALAALAPSTPPDLREDAP